MTKTAPKPVRSRPATILYLAPPAKKADISLGPVVFDGSQCSSKCISCSLFQKKCPSPSIQLNKKAKSWPIDRFRCIVCRSCVDTPPSKCLSMETQYTAPATAKGIEVFTIPYVKPAKPEKKEEPK